MFHGHLLHKVAVCVHDMPEERSSFFKCINNQNTSQQMTGSEKGRITVGGILTKNRRFHTGVASELGRARQDTLL